MSISTVPLFINTPVLSLLGRAAGPAAAIGNTGVINAGNGSSFISGGQVGYNWQSANSVVGIEADFQGVAGGRGTNSVVTAVPRAGFFPPFTVITALAASQRLNELGMVRGRLGILVTPSVLAYATIAAGYGQASSSASTSAVASPPTGVRDAAGLGSMSAWAIWVDSRWWPRVVAFQELVIRG